MNTATARSSLAQLRAKTDRELAILVRRELNRSMTFANEARCRDAERSLAVAKTLLDLTEISGNARASLEQEMDQIRQSLPCAMSAA
jgi:adenylylsulfate kinase-like enzyme